MISSSKKIFYVFYSSNLIVFLTEVACNFSWPQDTRLVCLLVNQALRIVYHRQIDDIYSINLKRSLHVYLQIHLALDFLNLNQPMSLLSNVTRCYPVWPNQAPLLV